MTLQDCLDVQPDLAFSRINWFKRLSPADQAHSLNNSVYANRIFMYFCIKSSIGTQGEVGYL